MTYEEAMAYIHAVDWRGSRPGLSRVRELCARLGDPQKELSCVHVGGTNGKGSFSCMLACVLQAAGKKTGLYTSPYVYRFNERMQIGGVPVSDEALAALMEEIKPHADAMEDPPTEFELITAAAFLWFCREKCDVVVLEVGLGGRLDATNIIEKPLLSAVTSIGLDHTAILGDTLSAIAGEKAGIIKPGCPVLAGELPEEALSVIRRAAEEAGAPFYQAETELVTVGRESLAGTEFTLRGEPYRIGLAGAFQPKNAAAVIRAAEILNIPREAVKEGLEKARWPARFEVLREDPTVIFDGGHNPQGVAAAVETVKRLGLGKVVLLTGMMRDKDYKTAARLFSEIADTVYCVEPDNPRALPAEEYAAEFPAAIPEKSVEAGVKAAMAAARAQGRPLLCAGSLYMYREARDAALA